MIRREHEIATPVISKTIQNAITKRAHLLNKGTNALRIFDGEGDGLPNVYIDTYADRWLISTRTNTLPSGLSDYLQSTGKTCYWKHLDQHEKESPTHIAGEEQNEPFIACESNVNYRIHFQSGYSQGIFLDQRSNRKRVRAQSNKNKTILNTFAYTGAFSICAALGGATTTTLDLSQVYLDWARENFHLNEIEPNKHYFCKGDTFHWLRRFARQGRTFDGIILDPPTFSRDDKGKVFRVEKDYHYLVTLAKACLAPNGWILCCTNYRKLSGKQFEQMVINGAGNMKISNLKMPEEYTEENYLKSIWLE